MLAVAACGCVEGVAFCEYAVALGQILLAFGQTDGEVK